MFSRNNLALIIFLIPLISDVFLPFSLETRFNFYYLNYSISPFFFFFIISTFYFLLTSSTSTIKNISPITTIFISLFILVTSALNTSENSTIYSFLIILFPWVFSGLIKWNISAVKILFWTFNISILFLLIQIILLSFGFISISVQGGKELGIIGEMSRVSTTFGAATTSSVLIYLLCGINFSLSYILYKRFYVSILYVFLGILFGILTFTRGLLLMSLLLLFLAIFYNYQNILKQTLGLIRLRIKKKAIVSIMLFLSMIITIFVISQRVDLKMFQRSTQEESISQQTFTSDDQRAMRRDIALKYFFKSDDNLVFGNGLGSYFVSDQFFNPYAYIPGHLGAPHNTYVLILVELGFAGIFLFLLFIFRNIYISFVIGNPIFILVFIPIIVIGFNTETIYLYPNINYIFFLFLRLASSKMLRK